METQSDPINQNQMPVQPPLPRNYFPLIIGGVILLVVVTGISYVLGSKSQKMVYTQSTPSASPTMQATPTIASNEMDGWNKYTDTDYAFSFSYPPQMNPHIVGGTKGGAYVRGIESFTPSNQSDLTLMIWKKDSYQLTHPINSTLEGIPAARFTMEDPSAVFNDHIVAVKGDYVYDLSLQYQDPKEIDLPLFNQIIASFKFAD
jgi:hypothetical protein